MDDAPRSGFLLAFQNKGLTVCALYDSGVCLMGADGDALKRAVVLGLTVVCTLLNRTFDTLVRFVAILIHIKIPPFIWSVFILSSHTLFIT